MKVKIHENNSHKIAEVISDLIILSKVQDALDLIVNPELVGIKKIILYKESINPDFFKLYTGLAGEILQKYANYQVKLAIVGDFSDIKSENFQAFIRESNRGKSLFFCADSEIAIQSLSR